MGVIRAQRSQRPDKVSITAHRGPHRNGKLSLYRHDTYDICGELARVERERESEEIGRKRE